MYNQVRVLALLTLFSCLAFGQLPDAPKPQKTKGFLKLATLDATISLTDSALSSKLIDGKNCHEFLPIFGSTHPSTTRYYVQNSAMTFGVIFVSRMLWPKHPKLAKTAMLFDTGAHAAGIGGTIQGCK